MNKIPLSRPYITEKDISCVVNILNSGMLVQGKEVDFFEKSMSRYIGSKHAIAVSNGTMALYLSLLAAGVKSGDEVIIPALSFVATANVVELIGATPIFVDICLDTFNIDVSKIEEAISPKTTVIMPVHEFGLSADITEIKKIADKHNLLIIEDAACALGAKENNHHVGTFGMAGCFSLHPRKSITCGEGGFIVTNDDLFAKKLYQLRNHGIEENFQFSSIGFNCRLTDFQASLVNSQFERFDEILEEKSKIVNWYLSRLENLNIKLPSIPENKNHTWQTFHIILNEKTDRTKLIETLKAKGIYTNYGAQCIPSLPYYQEKYKSSRQFANSWKAYKKGLVLPLYNGMSEEDLNSVVNELKIAIQ